MDIREHISLAPYTIYKIGGPARFFAEVKNSEDVRGAIEYAAAQRVPFFIFGAGSNMLISDKGFDGVAIRMMGGGVRVEENLLHADAGVMMARTVAETMRAGLMGFEWAIGVPGTIGGSVRGNAGCFGSEMRDVVESIKIFDAQKLELREMRNFDCEFDYRHSIFKMHPEWIILSTTLKLQKGDPQKIQEKVREITTQRTQKQDIGSKCCGCIFKNIAWDRDDINREKLLHDFPELAQFQERATIPSSYLIDHAGLKNKRVGSVVISPKHANFFVNEGGASAEDVIRLIAIAKDEVQKKYSIELKEEIQYIGW